MCLPFAAFAASCLLSAYVLVVLVVLLRTLIVLRPFRQWS